MDVIVTHESADFDALASAVVAARLYPGAQIVLGRSISGAVRDFLAVHKDRFRTLRHGDIDEARVQRLIVVDARRESRIAPFETLLRRIREGDASLEVHVYDHHPSGPDEIRATVRRVEPVGAATTLLLEELVKRELLLDPIEATLCALGIYADTGCFCHRTTTARDVKMGAWLLEQGANLSTMSRFLNPPLAECQRHALEQTLRRVRTVSIRGLEIGFSTLELERHCEGLDVVVTKALELEPLSALFVLAVVERRRVEVVARSRNHAVDIADALFAIGGGGYASAGAARVKHGDANRILRQLEQHLETHAERAERVIDVMSSPVRTILPDTKLKESDQLLAEWGYSGVPVVSGTSLLGVISQRDIEKARRAGRLDLPVSSHMTQRVVTIAPDATLEQALRELQHADVGRLVVVDHGSITGIVTRSDLLKVLYG